MQLQRTTPHHMAQARGVGSPQAVRLPAELLERIDRYAARLVGELHLSVSRSDAPEAPAEPGPGRRRVHRRGRSHSADQRTTGELWGTQSRLSPISPATGGSG
jgi:hypothetical protein